MEIRGAHCEPVTSTRAIQATARVLNELRVFRFGLLQDGDVQLALSSVSAASGYLKISLNATLLSGVADLPCLNQKS